MKTDTLFYQLFQNFPSIFIVLYKFPHLSREELEAMLELSDLKQTKVYQQAREEGQLEAKLKMVPWLLELGISIEEIAHRLGLEVEMIRQVATEQIATADSGDSE